jgi:predicted DNA-binding mobile mystery protein A
MTYNASMKASAAANLRRRQLDRMLRRAAALRRISTPERGWIREVRLALGMTAAQLGKRLGVSQAAVAQMERAEAAGTISIRALRRAAEALECDFKYVFLPKQSLEQSVRTRAQVLAADIARRVNDSMALEAQATDAESVKQQTSELAEELIRRLDHDLWNPPSEADLPGRGNAA